MTISATSQGLKPGVCTSSNRPANPYAGMMIFETDTNRLAVYNGSSWVVLADADTPPGMELVASGTYTSATAVTVDNCFTSNFRNYRLDVHQTSTSGTAVEGQLLLRVGGSNSTSTYYYQRTGYSYAGTIQAEVGASSTRWFVGRSHGSSNAGGSNAFSITIFGPAIADRTYYVGDAADALYACTVGGYHDTATAYDGFNLSYGGNTITGTYRLYGLRNS